MTELSANQTHYIAFVEYKLRKLHQLSRNNVDIIAYQLLEIIWAQYMTNDPLHVQQAMTLSHLGSASTLYRRIHLLLRKQWIEYYRNDHALRYKYIRPTAAGLMLFEDLCKGLSPLQSLVDADQS